VVVLAAFDEAGGKDGGLGTAAHAELCQQVRHVVRDRLFGQVHLVGDLSVGEAVGEQVEDPALLRRDALKRSSSSGPLRMRSSTRAVTVGSSSD
jgi:hypothetical protein